MFSIAPRTHIPRQRRAGKIVKVVERIVDEEARPAAAIQREPLLQLLLQPAQAGIERFIERVLP